MQNSLSKNIDAIVSAKDLANAVEDEFGVKYSKDGLRLLKSNENITNYVVTELGIVTEVRPLQPKKAQSPIRVTELGIVTEVRSLQL